MKLLKPSWVNHDGESVESKEKQNKPIFSIDIHPDGSRFATGGQGADSGKIVIWNMAPVLDEKVEKNDDIPKMLCQMDNHLACVNCIRWSHNGKYLASASDDKLVMLWQYNRSGGMSAVFGSGNINYEQWRCTATLRGHTGDVLDLAWSAHDAWLATCSVDNTVIVWNALKLPEQIAVLKQHTGLVKGVAWDPVGKYLASQSDDKTVRIWRTYDWQQETVITEPFQECGGTTHVLRLNWSPDGIYLVSAHAMNNSGPTAQIIERNGWKTNMDFVGHRKAVTAVRFNPNMFRKKIKKDTPDQFCCCAIASRDRSISIWLTSLKRPLVVVHDSFTSSILDVSWSKDGFSLMCCSYDGTVAFMNFTSEELGIPISLQETRMLHEKTYGKSLMFSSAASTPANQIIESAAVLMIQSEHNDSTVLSTPSKTMTSPQSVCSTPFKQSNTKQIETKTTDGRRRITPIFLAPKPDCGDAPVPFGTPVKSPVFSSSKSQSLIVIEKQDIITKSPGSASKEDRKNVGQPAGQSAAEQSKVVFEQAKDSTEMSSVPRNMASSMLSATITPIQSLSSSQISKDKSTEQKPKAQTKENDKLRDKEKTKQFSAKRKLETEKPAKKQRKEKELTKMSSSPVLTPVVNSTGVSPAVSHTVHTTSSIDLPVPPIDQVSTIQVSTDTVIDIHNNIHVNSYREALHKVQCVSEDTINWELVLTSAVIVAVANSFICCAACQDKSLSVFSLGSGRRLLPSIVLDSKVSILKCGGHYVMAITSQGNVYVWDLQHLKAIIKKESLQPILPDTGKRITMASLTERGVPLISLNNGKSYTFSHDMGCWLLIASNTDPLVLSSDHKVCSSTSARLKGTLSSIQSHNNRPGNRASQMMKSNTTLEQCSTISYIEQQMALCQALKSGEEYKFWFMSYIRYLAQKGVENKIRDVCDDLIGPLYKTKQSRWEPFIMGVNKQQLLKDILPIIGANLRLQRLFTEYKEQLDSL